MQFGLTNTLATFQHLMDCILAGLSVLHCLIYLDGIILFSSDYLAHLSAVFNPLELQA